MKHWFKEAGFSILVFVIGAAIMILGWWVSMINISVERYSGVNFTSLWSLAGLALIFVGAYLPFASRAVHLRRERKFDQERKEALAREADVDPSAQ